MGIAAGLLSHLEKLRGRMKDLKQMATLLAIKTDLPNPLSLKEAGPMSRNLLWYVAKPSENARRVMKGIRKLTHCASTFMASSVYVTVYSEFQGKVTYMFRLSKMQVKLLKPLVPMKSGHVSAKGLTRLFSADC